MTPRQNKVIQLQLGQERCWPILKLACCSTMQLRQAHLLPREPLAKRSRCGERLTIADNQHAVVQSGAAGRVKDAAGVQLELALVGLNGHADGLVGSRLHNCGRHQTVHDRTQAILGRMSRWAVLADGRQACGGT